MSASWSAFPSASAPLADFEAAFGVADPTHGPAHGVNPAAIDLASAATASKNPGVRETVAWSLDDPQWLHLRMRLADTPVHSGNSNARYTSYHWMFLIDADADGMSEFVVDVFGGDRAATAITPRYRDGSIAIFNSHACEDVPTGDVIADNAIAANEIVWAAAATKTENAHTRTVATGTGSQTWLEVAVPRSALVYQAGLCAGQRALSVGQPFGLFASTSASNTDPLQKDWMAGAVLAPSLALRLAADVASVAEGGRIVYTIVVRNDGSATASSPLVSDPLPPHVSFVSASDGGVFDPVTRTVTWSLSPLAPGHSATRQLEVRVDDNVPLSVLAVENVAFADGAASNLVIVDLRRYPAPYVVLAAAPTTIAPESAFDARATFGNSGDATLRDAVVTLTLSGPATFAPLEGCELMSTTTLRCPVGDLAAGATGAIDAIAVAASGLAGGTHDIVVSATLTHADGALGASPALVQVVAAPDLVITTTVSPPEIGPGQTARFDITYANVGNAAAEDVVLSWTPPEGVEVVAVSAGGVIGDDGVVRWPIGAVDPGLGGSVFVEVRLAPLPPPGVTQVSDVAVVTSTNAPPSSTVSQLTLIAIAQLTVSATASPGAVGPGGAFVYTVSYANDGAAAAQNAVIALDIAGPAAAEGPSALALPTLAAGATGSFEIPVRASAGLPAGAHLVLGTPTARASNADPAQGARVPVTVVAGATLALQASALPSIARPGELVTWELAYTNLGNGTAAGATVVDVPPAGLTVVSVSSGGAVGDDGLVRWSLGAIPAGASGAVSWTGRLAPTFPAGHTPLADAATLAAEGAAPATASATVVVSAAPVLTLSVAPDRAATGPGGAVTYVLRYANVGDADASDATLALALAGPAAPASATWTLGDIAAGAIGERAFTVDVDAQLPHGDHWVGATGSIAAPAATPVVATAPEVLVVARAALTLASAVAPGTAEPNDVARWTLSFANVGNATAQDAALSDVAPAGFLDVVAEGGAVAGSAATWELGDLAPGATGSVAMSARVPFPMPAGTTMHSDAARLDALGLAPTFASAPLAVVASPALRVSLAVDRTHALAGELITYTIGVENVGNADASGVLLADPIPPLVSFASASHGGGHDAGDNTARWSLGALPVGASRVVTLTVRVAGTLPDVDTPVVDVASASSAEGVAHTSDPVTTLVRGVPAIEITKSASVESAMELETVVYTITVSSLGTAHARDLLVTDALPEAHEFLWAQPAAATFAASTVSLLVPLLEAHGGVATLTIAARVGPVGVRLLPTCNIVVVTGTNVDTAYATACVDLLCALPRALPSSAHSIASPLPLAPFGDLSVHQVGLGERDAGKGSGTIEFPLGSVELVSMHGVTAVAAEAADAWTSYELGRISLLEGRIQATGAIVNVSAHATADEGRWELHEARFIDLVIDGVPYTDVGPNTRVALGGAAYVVLNDVSARSTIPTQGRDGRPAREVIVEHTLLRVFVAGQDLPGDTVPPIESVEYRLGIADARAVHAVEPDCAGPSSPRVFAEAVAVHAGPSDTTLARVAGTSGGSAERGVALFADGTAFVDAARTEATARVTLETAEAAARVETGRLSLLGGLITADALHASASKRLGEDAVVGEVRFVDLRIAGVPYEGSFEPNTRVGVPGVGIVVLNEQMTRADGTFVLTMVRVIGGSTVQIGKLSLATHEAR